MTSTRRIALRLAVCAFLISLKPLSVEYFSRFDLIFCVRIERPAETVVVIASAQIVGIPSMELRE